MSSLFTEPHLDTLNYPILKEFYAENLVLDPELVEQILALPTPALIEDLEQIVRLELQKVKAEEADYEFMRGNALFQALMWLGYLKSEKSFPLILEVWRLDEASIDVSLGDLLFDDLWQVLIFCGTEQIEQLQLFILDHSVPFVYSKVEIIQVLSRMVYFLPNRSAEIKKIFGALLDHFTRIPDEQFTEEDEIVVAFLAYEVSVHGWEEFLPLVESLFEADRVDLMLMGDWEDYWHEFGKKTDDYAFYPDIRDWYQERGLEWDQRLREQKIEEALYLQRQKEEKEFKKAQEENRQRMQDQHSKASNKKIGRNDPCPCGSGKKYKKCHGKL